MPLSREQIALIHVAKDRVGMDEDDYRAVLRRVGGVESSRQLDAAGFTAVMKVFERCGFQSDAARKAFGNRTGMASAGQVQLIRKLWQEFAGAEAADKSLGVWLDRKFKVSSIRFVTAAAAPKVIAALTAMAERRQPT